MNSRWFSGERFCIGASTSGINSDAAMNIESRWTLQWTPVKVRETAGRTTFSLIKYAIIHWKVLKDNTRGSIARQLLNTVVITSLFYYYFHILSLSVSPPLDVLLFLACWSISLYLYISVFTEARCHCILYQHTHTHTHTRARAHRWLTR